VVTRPTSRKSRYSAARGCIGSSSGLENGGIQLEFY
jgi:hypothetical protein